MISTLALTLASFDLCNLFIWEAGCFKCSLPVNTIRRYILLEIYPWVDASLYSLGPLTFFVVFNVLIVKQLKNQGRDVGLSRSADLRRADNQKQITSMLLGITFAFIILTLPMAVLEIVEIFWDYEKDSRQMALHILLTDLSDDLAWTNHTVNFWFYFFRGEKFRKELWTIIGCLRYSKPKLCCILGPSVASTCHPRNAIP